MAAQFALRRLGLDDVLEEHDGSRRRARRKTRDWMGEDMEEVYDGAIHSGSFWSKMPE